MRNSSTARAFVCGLVACGLAVSSAAFAGSVSGKITYDDKVPALKPLDMAADPVCQQKHSSPAMPEFLVLGPGNGLANVFIQVKTPPAGDHKAPSPPAVIDQQGCLYHPHVLGLMVGQELLFKNDDGVLHNVHGLPKENREFNIGMPPTLKEKGQVLNKPEPLFKVKCDVHPWMNAFVAVMTHPYFAVSGPDGQFKIENLPAGNYELEAWHEKLGTQTQKVTVGADGTATANFSFKVPQK